MKPDSQAPSKIDFYLLLLAAFLAPIIGGHVALEPRPISEGLFGELFGGGALPYLSRLILGTLILAALALMAFRNRVIQLPNIKIIGTLSLLVFTLGFAIIFGDFHFVAVGEWLSWFVFGGALFLAVGTLGRGNGPIQLASALSAGITVAAVRGILEYTRMMANEPSYRIFAGWNNPNAVATIFVAGALLQLGLLIRAKDFYKAFPLVGSGACLAALLLTQSKGGYLAFIFGFIVFLGVLVASKSPGKNYLAPLGAMVLGAVLAFGLTNTGSSAHKTQALSRISASSASAEQSVGFRQNLWKSAIQIAQHHPGGTGPGTFRFYSAEPGITDITVFAHQSFLQLAVEGGWFALLLFLALAYFWLTYAFRGLQKQPADLAGFRAGALAATLALAAHGMVESNLSFMGSGLLLFLLVALTLQLSTDGTSPEAVPRTLRLTTLLISCVAPLLGLAIYAAGEAQKSTLVTALVLNQPEKLAEAAAQLKVNPYGDPEATYFGAIYGSTNAEERLKGLQAAATKMPQPRILRATARALSEMERYDEAISINERVFKYDPNNLNAHWLKIELLVKKEDISAALQAARDLIKVENTISYQVRAIPEIIPTETFEARLLLAQNETDRAKKIELLEQALTGFSKYFSTTAPLVKRMTDGGLPDYGGQSRDDVEQKLLQAKAAFKELTELYGPSGSPSSGVNLTEISKSLEFSF